jgi:outer membrane protein OmpA-like peptidoglycan-associated protein
VTLTPREITLATPIRFKTSRADIRPQDLPALDAVVAILRARPRITLEVQCHTGGAGEPRHALHMAGKRANAIRAYLVSGGVAPRRLDAHGYGEPTWATHLPPTGPRRCVFVRTDVP